MDKSAENDKQFDASVSEALEIFRAKFGEQAALRQVQVLTRLREEMMRLRPHKNRLLYGIEDPPKNKA